MFNLFDNPFETNKDLAKKEDNKATEETKKEVTPAKEDKAEDKPVDTIQNQETDTKQKSDKKEEKKNKPANKEDDINTPIGKPMIVRLYGQSIYIDDVNKTPEDIRKQLEKDFPELSKSRTVIEVNKKKGFIFFSTKAAKKGAALTLGNLRGTITRDELENFIRTGQGNFKPINEMTCDNQVYEVRINEIGVFVASLTNPGKGEFTLLLPKIPKSLLNPIIKQFHIDALFGVESGAQIFWDRENKEYFVNFPEQVKGHTTLEIERDVELERKHLLVMEIHSHHFLPAFFSSQDDEDEVATMLYGVVGKLLSSSPTMLFRASCAGKFIPINEKNIFSKER